MSKGPIWDDVFMNGHAEFNSKMHAVATGLSGWACAMSSGDSPIPTKFGDGMLCIYNYIGESPSLENLNRIAEEFLKDKTAE